MCYIIEHINYEEMAKVYFYKIDLIEKKSDKEGSLELLKDSLVDVIDAKSKKIGRYWVLDLSQEKELHFISDIFTYKKDYMFLRISKQRPSGGFLYRNYSTNVPQSLLGGVSETEEGIEMYTYALIDYSTGILSIVKEVGAPTHTTLNNIFKNYNDKYFMRFLPIANKNGIERIYKASESCISQIEIEVPVPDAETLEKMFHWNDKDILDIQGKNLKAVMRVSSIDRKMITDDAKETQNLIDIIKKYMNIYRKAKIRAKTDTVKTQDYNFKDENFSYEIQISRSHLVGGEKKYYSAEELCDIYKQSIFSAYEENKKLLRKIINR